MAYSRGRGSGGGGKYGTASRGPDRYPRRPVFGQHRGERGDRIDQPCPIGRRGRARARVRCRSMRSMTCPAVRPGKRAAPARPGPRRRARRSWCPRRARQCRRIAVHAVDQAGAAGLAVQRHDLAADRRDARSTGPRASDPKPHRRDPRNRQTAHIYRTTPGSAMVLHRFPAGFGVLGLARPVLLHIPGRGDHHHVAVVGVLHRRAEGAVGGVPAGRVQATSDTLITVAPISVARDDRGGEGEHVAVAGVGDGAGAPANCRVRGLERQAESGGWT